MLSDLGFTTMDLFKLVKYDIDGFILSLYVVCHHLQLMEWRLSILLLHPPIKTGNKLNTASSPIDLIPNVEL